MDAHNNEGRYLLSAAIDFGTTYSGLAYSYANDQDTVYVISEWPDGTVANKIPTTILFDANFNFKAFGQEAIDDYERLAEDGEEKKSFLFHRFKMDLYKKKVNKTLQMKDITGKTMNALTVFSASIKFLKDYLISTITERYPANIITEADINWTLTVPAIWDDAAKQFMREAGHKAGISRRNLQIALEPEAASLYCLKTPRDKMILGGHISSINTKYLVIDSGGGTVDITAHQVTVNNKVNELHKASGGAMGGTQVDEQFADYLSTLFSQKNILEIQNKHPTQWIRILQDFELAKKKMNPKNKDQFVTIATSSDILDIQYFQKLLSHERKNAELKMSGRLRIPKSVIKEMISHTASKVSSHVQSLLQKPELNGIEYIVMVGGFSNSSILVNKIKNLTEVNNLAVLVPEEAQMSVVKGAVLLGWKPEVIIFRKCRRTYGIKIKAHFIEGVHPDRHIVYINESEKMCDNVFDTLVHVNQDIEIDHAITRNYIQPVKSTTTTCFRLYATNAPNADYCNDDGVFKVGELSLQTPYYEDNSLEVQVFFGKSEIHVKAKHLATGNTTEEKFDFL